MIRMFQCQTADHAKNYFKSALSKADYYIQDQELEGHFNGKLAKRLGLEGQIADTEIFNKLCDNINPTDGGSLTPRTVVNRRVGYDISFHAPKSVSLLYGLNGEEKTLQAFQQSVHETMLEIEADMQTRVRIDGQYDDRSAPYLLWADFTHLTARPTKDHVADAHLHTHCFTFNGVYDEVEDKIKAGQFHNIKRDMPYYQARFQKRLADKFSEMGHGVRKTKNGFELSVIPQKAIDLFSKRTNHIGQVAKEKGITDLKALDQLGALTRGKKQPNLSMEELRTDWVEQIDEAGIDEQTPEEKASTNVEHSPKKSVDFALTSIFTRKSVRRDRQILAEAYKHSIDNRAIEMDKIDRVLESDKRVFKIEVGSQRLCTTQLVHKQERAMINLAREGIGKVRPLSPNFDVSKFTYLNEEQCLAMRHVMTSSDRLTMIRGAAGTGKTTLFKTLVPEIEEAGKRVYLFAPTAEASRDVLRNEGFKNADTVARLLKDYKLQEKLKDEVIIVDEAGMLGTQDMAAIQEIAKEQKARLVLSGDPRQHPAVLRGDAMRLCQDVGKIPVVSMETIYRQKNKEYREAVRAINDENVATGFEILDKMGAVKECDPKETDTKLVEDYLATREAKKSALVVTPTRLQMKVINDKVRLGLRERGLIGKREKTFTIYDNHHLTVPQKRDSRFYEKGQIIQAKQNLPSHNGGIKKGAVLEIIDIENKQILIRDRQGKDHILPTHKAKDYDLYTKRKISLSKGDEIRIINKNGFDKNHKRLENRTALTVTGFTKEGHIKTIKQSASRKTEFLLNKEHGNFEHGYAITSYSSQGKTVDKIIISQPSATFLASNQKQFYVSVSRGRENPAIYTDDAEELLTHIKKNGDRQGATELVETRFNPIKEYAIEQVKHQNLEKTILNNKDYEPEI